MTLWTPRQFSAGSRGKTNKPFALHTHRETEGKFREVKPRAQEGLSDLEIQPIISQLARPTRAYVSLT